MVEAGKALSSFADRKGILYNNMEIKVVYHQKGYESYKYHAKKRSDCLLSYIYTAGKRTCLILAGGIFTMYHESSSSLCFLLAAYVILFV